MKEAFKNNEKLSSILIYVENQKINEEAVKILAENIPMMDESKVHLALNLLNHIDPELALKYKEPLERYISEDSWSLYELIINGTEEEVYTEYRKTLNALEQAKLINITYLHKSKKTGRHVLSTMAGLQKMK